jgi:flagellar basal-body rod protein FlgF
MDALTIAAASGMQARMQALDLLANNLANAGTSGYKGDREFYGLFSRADATDSMGIGPANGLPVVERQWTDFSQGTLQPTGNPLDVAISGRGFLAVNGPGGTLYTRNGSLQLSSSGELVTSEGYPVRSGDKTIHAALNKPIEISTDGEVRQDGAVLGKLEIVDFKSTESLRKLSGACFENSDPNNPPAPAQDVRVEQGKVEGSNVAVPESAMRLVGMMRQFEMLQKAVTMGVDMNAKAIQEVARVGA